MTEGQQAISGATRLAALFGYPARYSLSPSLHNAAYAAMGIDARYVVLPVQPEDLGVAVASVRAFDMLGASVTLPHKEGVIEFLDEISPTANALNAVNTIVNDSKRLIGHNTDGDGFVTSLNTDAGFTPAQQSCVVLGAGGAARAVVLALANAGASEIAIINRTPERSAACVDLAPQIARIGTTSDIATASLVVNATPVGQHGVGPADETPVDTALLSDQHLVVDLIYVPEQTQLLINAEKQGAQTLNGLGMLIHQAARQIELWTGQQAPVDIMRNAVTDN